MELLISLPDEFAEHFNFDAFQDSFNRIKSDISTNGCLSGRYERELVDALTSAFFKAKCNSTEADTPNLGHISKGEAYDILRHAGIPVELDGFNDDVKLKNCALLIGIRYAFLTLIREGNEIYTTSDNEICLTDLTMEHINKFISNYKALEKEISK